MPLAVLLFRTACTEQRTAPRPFSKQPSTFAVKLTGTGPGGVAAGLRIWLRASEGISAADGGAVTAWADQSGNANHAIWTGGGAFAELPPVFDASNPGVLRQPTVRLNAQHALELNLTSLTGSDYTIFVANGRDRGGLANFYIAGDLIADNRNLVLGYERTGLLREAHFNNDLDAVVEDYTGTEVWSLDIYRFAQAEGRDLFHNGTSVASDDNAIPLLSNTGATLGHFRAIPGFWFQGDLAEILVYDRALSADEKVRVEAELAGRYGVGLRAEDYVPCASIWQNHGEYVAAHAHAVKVRVAAGAMSPASAGASNAAAAGSNCGG